MKYSFQECDMLLDCYTKLNSLNKYTAVVLEVPYMSRCIDMIIIDENKIITTIEFKLSDWRSALKQARDHSMGADKAYICLPNSRKNLSAELISAVKDTGVGLMLYNKDSVDPLEVVIQPMSNLLRWSIWTESLQNKIDVLLDSPIFSQ